MTPFAERELKWADIAMQLDLCESRIADASTCHGYWLRDGITVALRAELRRIGEAAK